MQKIILVTTILTLFSPLSYQANAGGKVKSTKQAGTAVSSATQQVNWSSVNSGSNNMSSTNYGMKATLGQGGIGYGVSTNYKSGLGYWYGAEPVCAGKPGDANASGTYTLGDVISIVNYIFNKDGCTDKPLCWLSNLLCRGDWNGSGTVSLSDVIQAVNFIFNKPGGPWNAVKVGVCCL